MDAIRLGDPAEVRRQLNELEAGFDAFQSVVGERFGAIEERQSKAEQQLADTTTRLADAVKVAQTEARMLLLAVGALAIIAIIVPLIR